MNNTKNKNQSVPDSNSKKLRIFLIKAYNFIPFLSKIHVVLNKLFNKVNRTHNFKVNNIKFKIQDSLLSVSPTWLKQEIKYDKSWNILNSISFNKGDIVIDIGANLGIISIYLAKKHPNITIYSFEPSPLTFKYFQKNIKINKLSNIIPHNMAVTKDDRDVKMLIGNVNSLGNSIMNLEVVNSKNLKKTAAGNTVSELIPSISLDNIIKKYNIETVALLKMDCEGAEYEILYNTQSLLKIENLIAEFHGEESEIQKLQNFTKKNLLSDTLFFVEIHKADEI